jgi:protocatechuate 3,4-dioxygenase beta subunit
MTVGPDGVPRFIGNGDARAVVSGTVIDSNGKPIGDLHEVATAAVAAWESLFREFGLMGNGP